MGGAPTAKNEQLRRSNANDHPTTCTEMHFNLNIHVFRRSRSDTNSPTDGGSWSSTNIVTCPY